jgi:hypothetical protein
MSSPSKKKRSIHESLAQDLKGSPSPKKATLSVSLLLFPSTSLTDLPPERELILKRGSLETASRQEAPVGRDEARLSVSHQERIN